MQNIKIPRSLRLISATLLLFFTGIIYAWSILKVPFGAEFGWSSTQLGMNYTITMSFFCVGVIFGGLLLKKLSSRGSLLVGTVTVFVGFMSTSFVGSNIISLYVSYGVLCGTGIGIIYNIIISVVPTWYPDKRATVSGIMMMGFGISSLILGSVSNVLLEQLGWRMYYRVFGVAILIVALIGCLLLRENDSPPPKTENKATGRDIPPGQMVKTSAFWKLYVYTMLCCAIGGCVISFARDIALSVGAIEAVAVVLVGVLSVSNGVSRIIFGFLFDKLGRRIAMIVAGIVTVLAMTVMLLALGTSSVALVTAALVLVGLAYGSAPTLSASATSRLFGTKSFATNFSILNTQQVPAAFSATLGGAILTATGSFSSLFWLLLALAVGILLLALSLKDA